MLGVRKATFIDGAEHGRPAEQKMLPRLFGTPEATWRSSKRTSWSSPREALENWRDHVEEKGVFVFKDAFQDDFIDGFCLFHEQFPVIYLNNSSRLSDRFSHSFMSWRTSCSAKMASHTVVILEMVKLRAFATNLRLNFWCHSAIGQT